MSQPSSELLETNDQQCEILRQHIQASLQKAEAQRVKLKTIDRRYSIINLCLGTLATFIAGQSGVSNEPLIVNWRTTATVASVLSLSVTIVGGIQKQLAAPDMIAEANECVAKLKALKIETVVPNFEVDQVSEEYQQILSNFTKVDC
jgi:hypothetical protein